MEICDENHKFFLSMSLSFLITWPCFPQSSNQKLSWTAKSTVFCRMCKLTLTLHTSKKGCPNFETNSVIGLPGQIIEGENYLEIVKEEGALTTKGYDHLILRNLWSF